jgi:hypothetical protein
MSKLGSSGLLVGPLLSPFIGPLRSGAVMNFLHHWIYVGSNAYDEYTFVPWLNKNVYRRTVALSDICIQ